MSIKRKRKPSRKSVSEMADSYIKTLITRGNKIPRHAVPNSLVEAKRAQLKLFRFVRDRRG